jgi:hypothetical protein
MLQKAFLCVPILFGTHGALDWPRGGFQRETGAKSSVPSRNWLAHLNGPAPAFGRDYSTSGINKNIHVAQSI